MTLESGHHACMKTLYKVEMMEMDSLQSIPETEFNVGLLGLISKESQVCLQHSSDAPLSPALTCSSSIQTISTQSTTSGIDYSIEYSNLKQSTLNGYTSHNALESLSMDNVVMNRVSEWPTLHQDYRKSVRLSNGAGSSRTSLCLSDSRTQGSTPLGQHSSDDPNSTLIRIRPSTNISQSQPLQVPSACVPARTTSLSVTAKKLIEDLRSFTSNNPPNYEAFTPDGSESDQESDRVKSDLSLMDSLNMALAHLELDLSHETNDASHRSPDIDVNTLEAVLPTASDILSNRRETNKPLESLSIQVGSTHSERPSSSSPFLTSTIHPSWLPSPNSNVSIIPPFPPIPPKRRAVLPPQKTVIKEEIVGLANSENRQNLDQTIIDQRHFTHKESQQQNGPDLMFVRTLLTPVEEEDAECLEKVTTESLFSQRRLTMSKRLQRAAMRILNRDQSEQAKAKSTFRKNSASSSPLMNQRQSGSKPSLLSGYYRRPNSSFASTISSDSKHLDLKARHARYSVAGHMSGSELDMSKSSTDISMGSTIWTSLSQRHPRADLSNEGDTYSQYSTNEMKKKAKFRLTFFKKYL